MPSTRAPSRSEPALDRAVRLLAGRDFTAAELDRRLERAGVDLAGRQDVLARLASAGYLDDDRVVRARAGRLAERGYGDAAIRLDLEGRGASHELIEEAIAELEPESRRAEKLIGTLGRDVRAARALAQKGFSEACINQKLPDVAQDP
jgi:SOS response regulatory protein OraA/RecX